MSLTEVEPRAVHREPSVAVTRLGVVRYLNTRPLIAGLERLQGLCLRGEVPADLIGTLERGETDAALCSSIDFQRSACDLVVLPVGLLGCDGPTMTVKIFSRVPLERVRRLHADADSHTSRVLAQLVLAHRNGVAPELVDGVPADANRREAESMLLIGDKVVLEAPSEAEFPHRIDLGEAWKSQTGLPFTFACWMAPRPADARARERLRTLAQVLDHQRRRNAMRPLAAIEALVAEMSEKSIPAIFAETTVSDRSVRAIVDGCAARGHEVRVGESLYSDSLGSAASDGATWAGMLRHNARAIAAGLGGRR